MKIESLHIKNFKAYKDARLENLPAFCVIVGANGTGKSTLFDIFAFIKDCLTFNLTKALQARGGFDEIISRGCGGQDTIHFEIKCTLPVGNSEEQLTYELEIGQEQNNPYVKREKLTYGDAMGLSVLDFSCGDGYVLQNEEARYSNNEADWDGQSLDAKDMLAIKGCGHFQQFKAASAIRRYIESWHLSNFNINAACGVKETAGFSEHLSATGDNLQRVAKQIKDNHPVVFNTIIENLRRRVPGIDGVEILETPDKRLLLRFNSGDFKDPFMDRNTSDGTLKIFAYLVLLHDPQPHSFLCVEEPENQLYHTLLPELAEEFRAYAIRGGQVFVSTHSPEFLNAVALEEVYWLEKHNGFTAVKRAADDPKIRAFMSEGDQMGYLWSHNFFGEIAPR